MAQGRHSILACLLLLWTTVCSGVLLAAGAPEESLDDSISKEEAACRNLARLPNLTILSAALVDSKGSTPQYCHVVGLISSGIHWHMQLPLPDRWNGRLVNIGNGGKAGNLVSADNRVAQGYAVANSNTGHDNGAEPYASFAFNNRQAEIDFGYRAVHLTANASKTLVKAYYGKEAAFAYFEGCSTGGRQGLMEAQRFPYDFDGIVVGAPAHDYQKLNMGHVWILQRILKDNMAGSLAYDIAGDGSFTSLTKLNMLKNSVMTKCDALDGIKDGVIDDPLRCDFKPDVDLARHLCPGDVNADECFTHRQIQVIKDIYGGARDSKGTPILRGVALGSESGWAAGMIPYGGNNFLPAQMSYEVDHTNYLFYENDPGVPPMKPTDLSYKPDRRGVFPEVPWWEFNIDEVTSGKGDFMSRILDATDPDLKRFLNTRKGKLIMYQGWVDPNAKPESIIDYYKNVLDATFHGDAKAASAKMRLFMAPGMDHCGGGPGPNDWDKLAPLADWVENSKAPDYVVAVHRSERRGETAAPVENERKLCPYPQHAVYTGPAGRQNDPTQWVEKNFSCR